MAHFLNIFEYNTVDKALLLSLQPWLRAKTSEVLYDLKWLFMYTIINK